jgi:hypothetical protein
MDIRICWRFFDFLRPLEKFPWFNLRNMKR